MLKDISPCVVFVLGPGERSRGGKMFNICRAILISYSKGVLLVRKNNMEHLLHFFKKWFLWVLNEERLPSDYFP